MGTRRLRAWLAAGLVAAIAATSLALPSAVHAHAEFDYSEPPADEAVPVSPERLDAWFTQELFRRAGANALEVTGPDGTRVDTGDTVIDEADRQHMWVALQPDLPPGEYTVLWRTLSATDGDEAEGTFVFTIDPDATPVPTPTATETPTAGPETPTPTATEPPPPAAADDGTPFPWWAVLAGGGVLLAGLGAAWALRMTGDEG